MESGGFITSDFLLFTFQQKESYHDTCSPSLSGSFLTTKWSGQLQKQTKTLGCDLTVGCRDQLIPVCRLHWSHSEKLLPASDSQNNTRVILWVRLKDSDSTRHFLCDVWIVSVRRRRPASRKRINMSLFPLQVCSITRSASLKYSRWSQLLKLTLWGWGVVWQSAVCLAWIEPRRRHKNMFTCVKAEECHRDEWTGKEQ